ncbi:GAF domain-containing sensor histidine kinase [Arthrobacter sp. B10-11]|uniref:GAF domain-containing sensor histidine kinase n=1 Tax=Arthrobacter sp. B10-11 TaxID=3081160 RepID=UPI002954D791|nr:GAF domain-containing sensor histidine kinase [Arthrobacter sp. B10-11]MDV8148848.1 GAF domain-containing sensor histidine kinase [Arthrobacter sp. B10-11]
MAQADGHILTSADRERRSVLDEYGLLPQEPAASPSDSANATAARALNFLVDLAAKLCGVPYSVVNIVTPEHQVQLAAAGLEPGLCAREDSMCAKVFQQGQTTVVPDASADPRFAANPFVTGEIASVRFYASSPLQTSSGFVLGSLCVFSDGPAVISAEQVAMLDVLAAQVVEVLELQHRTLQLQQALEELGRSNRKLAEFAGRVSHDLRIPLTTILGYVELSEDDEDIRPGGPAAMYLQRIGGSGRRMLSVLDEVLSYSQVGGMLRPQPVSLRAAVAAAVSDLGDGFGNTALDCEDSELTADPAQLRTLLQNLLGNAFNYRRPGHDLKVRVYTLADDRGVTLRVSDNGKGIDAADRERVLEPLVRLHRPGDAPGSGLGLATCVRIVRSHGGELSLTETPGGGTTVSALFPKGGPGGSD